jgi:hypothetical protein
MSLDVSPDLLEQARQGTVNEAAFAATVRESLPYACDLIAGLSAELAASGPPGWRVKMEAWQTG